MKDRKYWHSEVDVIDIEFNSIKVDTNINYKDIVNNYNNADNINDKLIYAKQLPDDLFCTCRFCGEKIINKNFYIVYNKKESTLKNCVPKVEYRVVDGIRHKLSCCEKCLLEHFNDNKPKAQKYYFMKGNKYGAYSYGLSDDEYKKICSVTTGVTEKAMINKWGEEEGKRK